MTKFARALFYNNKYSHNTPLKTWKDVPVQDFKEPWWDLPIEQLEEKLFDKYNVPQDIRAFVLKNIQKKDESNIENS